MTVGILEVHAATAVVVVDFLRVFLSWIGPVLQPLGPNAAEDLIEVAFADQEGIVLPGGLARRRFHEVERDAVGEFDHLERPEASGGGQAEDFRQELGRSLRLLAEHDGVVELNAHLGSSSGSIQARATGPWGPQRRGLGRLLDERSSGRAVRLWLVAESPTVPDVSNGPLPQGVEVSALGPLALGFAVGTGLLVLYAAWEYAFGHLGSIVEVSFGSPERSSLRIALTLIALTGFMIGAHSYARRAAVRDIEELGPSLRGAAQEHAALLWEAQSAALSAGSWSGSLVAIPIGLLV